jgi:L-malate glycosyltransferase
MIEKPIRVFHLIKGLGRGGAEVLLLECLRMSDRRRFCYGYGFFLPWKSAMARALEYEGGEIQGFATRGNLTMMLSAHRVARHLQIWRADVVHCHLPLAGVVGRIAGRLANIPVVYTEHNTLERYHRVTRQLNLCTWRWQSQVIAVSRDVATSLQRRVSADVPIDVVPNGVNTTHFDPRRVDGTAVRQQLGIGPDKPIVGTVAVFRVQKRLEDWMAAAARIHERMPQVRFVLLGDGPERSGLRALATSMGLDGVLHFMDAREDVRPVLASLDIYAMSSEFEGLPVALLEAMAMQRACVVTSVGGIPEVIRHGINGMLVPKRDPAALAGAIVQLLESPGVADAYGRAARQTVIDNFSMLRMVRDLESKYREVLHRRRNGH